MYSAASAEPTRPTAVGGLFYCLNRSPFIFYKSSHNYAIPAGAFCEFLNWLTPLNLGVNSQGLYDKTLSRESLIEHLSEYLDISVGSGSQHSDEAIYRIADKLNTRNLVLNRVLDSWIEDRKQEYFNI